jgi:WD40 repeat protein
MTIARDSNVVCGDVIGGIFKIDLVKETEGEYFAQCHNGGIQCLDSMGECVVSGAQDAKVRVWDHRAFQRNCLEIVPGGLYAPECWVVRFAESKGNVYIFAGWENGDLKRINITSGGKIDWEENMSRNGVVSLDFDSNSNRLLVTCMNGHVRLYDINTLQFDIISVQSQLKSTLQDQKKNKSSKIPDAYQTIWTGRFLPNHRQFISITAGNGTLGIYNAETRKPVDLVHLGFGGNLNTGEFDGGEGALISLDWNSFCVSSDPSIACVCSLDQTIRTVQYLPLK